MKNIQMRSNKKKRSEVEKKKKSASGYNSSERRSWLQIEWCYRKNENPQGSQWRKKRFSSSINGPLLTFNKPSKDRFLEMSEALHLMWKYFTLSLNKEITPWQVARACTFFWGTTKIKEKRRKKQSTSTFTPGVRMCLTSQSANQWHFWILINEAFQDPGFACHTWFSSVNFHPKSESAFSVKKAQKCYERKGYSPISDNWPTGNVNNIIWDYQKNCWKEKSEQDYYAVMCMRVYV